MLYPTRFLLLAMTFLVPNTQAIISNSSLMAGESTGYHCETGIKSIKVSIHYDEEQDEQGCKVILERNESEIIPLLEAKRNTSICENKIEGMKLRLIDRGWHCRAYDP